MAIVSHRSVFSYLLVGVVCVTIGFYAGRSNYGQQVMVIGRGGGEIYGRTAGGTAGGVATSGTAGVAATLRNVSAQSDANPAQSSPKDAQGPQFRERDWDFGPPAPLPGQQSKNLTCNVHDIQAPSEDKHECVKTKWTPPFYICIHPITKDIYVSKSIKRTGIWEKHLLEIFQRLLRKDPAYGVIDIGANIGQYALLGGMMGRPVVAVEARLLHVEMIHHALKLNHLEAVDRGREFVLLHNAISDNHNELQIRLTEAANQGHTQVLERGVGTGIPENEIRTVPAITMDDLLEVIHFDKAIIKMDIEGSEHRAIRHCEKLLSQVYIPYIFMEWMWQRKKDTDGNSIVKTLRRNGYKAHGLDKKELRTGMRLWPVDIIWKHQNATF